MITREQVADLRPGDVVELTMINYPDVRMTGPVREQQGQLLLGWLLLRYRDGAPGYSEDVTLTVVSRAPRPLYVNHPRTEPVPGDVVRDADTDDPMTWHHLPMSKGMPGSWYDQVGYGVNRSDLPARLRLLVDGETGRCVP